MNIKPGLTLKDFKLEADNANLEYFKPSLDKETYEGLKTEHTKAETSTALPKIFMITALSVITVYILVGLNNILGTSLSVGLSVSVAIAGILGIIFSLVFVSIQRSSHNFKKRWGVLSDIEEYEGKRFQKWLAARNITINETNYLYQWGAAQLSTLASGDYYVILDDVNGEEYRLKKEDKGNGIEVYKVETVPVS